MLENKKSVYMKYKLFDLIKLKENIISLLIN